jgi:hypothetical protein
MLRVLLTMPIMVKPVHFDRGASKLGSNKLILARRPAFDRDRPSTFLLAL